MWTKGPWALKAYGIHHREPNDNEPLMDGQVLEAARGQVDLLVSKADNEGNHYHTGFAVLHQGLEGNWLLLQLWAHNDICCQILMHATAKTPTKFELVTRPFMACVWELVVIEFERQAWIDAVLAGAADRQSYLDRRLADGRY